MKLRHEFVELIPDKIEAGVLYISMDYCTAIHKCVCGCGNEVVTPLSPTDWKLTFNGETVSLHPSIGNWGFECKSHYWIINNAIEFSEKWGLKQIERNRKEDMKAKNLFFNKRRKKK